MKHHIKILLIVTMLLPMINDLQAVAEPSCAVVANGGQYFDEPSDEVEWKAPPKTLSLSILLKATILRRFTVIRVKCLRRKSRKPIIKSEAARHSEMRSGDVSSMRI